MLNAFVTLLYSKLCHNRLKPTSYHFAAKTNQVIIVKAESYYDNRKEKLMVVTAMLSLFAANTNGYDIPLPGLM